MTQRFEYKPALLAKLVTLETDDVGVIWRQGDTVSNISYADISGIRYWSMSAQRTRFCGLDITGSNGQEIKIRMNFPGRGATESEAFAGFQAIQGACLEAIFTHRPELKVEIGQKPWVKWTIFLIGLGLLIFCASLPVLGWMDGRSDRLSEATIPLLLGAVVGGSMCWSFRPWQQPLLLDMDVVLLAFGRGPLKADDFPDDDSLSQ